MSNIQAEVAAVCKMTAALAERVTPKSLANLRTMLWSVDWQIGPNLASQREIAEANIALSPNYCHGRIALAAALAEKYFPGEEVYLGEVWEDGFRNNLLAQIRANSYHDRSWLAELLSYEEPHSILVVESDRAATWQFDPLSVVVGQQIDHPRAQAFPLWHAITAAWLVARASLCQTSKCQLERLEWADSICPGTMLVLENKVAAFAQLGRMDEATEAIEEIVSRRPTARSLFVAHVLTGRDTYLQKLLDTYPAGVIELIREEGGM